MEYFAHSQKAFIYKYVVMLSDIDQFRHMSFANYLKLMFLASDALFLSCFDLEFVGKNRLKLLNSRFQFKRQTQFGDKVLIKINSTSINRSSFVLLYTFVMEETAELVALGRQTFEVLLHADVMPLNEIPEQLGRLLHPIRAEETHLLYKY